MSLKIGKIKSFLQHPDHGLPRQQRMRQSLLVLAVQEAVVAVVAAVKVVQLETQLFNTMAVLVELVELVEQQPFWAAL
jgi:hypothetical protein